MGIFIFIRNNELSIEIDTRSKREKYMIPVIQIDEKGEIVGEFPSIAAASRETKINNIGDCVLGKRLSAGGYKWQSVEEKYDR